MNKFFSVFSLVKIYIARTFKTNPFTTSLSISERILFTNRLSLYLRSGISITTALSLIVENAATTQTSGVYSHILKEVTRGRSLNQALRIFPKSFDLFEINTITIGERSGTLAQSLSQISLLLSRKKKLKRKIVSALIYPFIIVLGTICVTSFLTLFAFPKIIPLFKGFHTALPLSTRILIALSEGIKHYGWYLFCISISCIGGLIYASRKEPVRKRIHALILRIPLIRSLIKDYYLSLFGRTIASLLTRGVSLVEALALTRSGIKNSSYHLAFEEIELLLSRGQKLSHGMERYPHLFPSMAVQLVSVGETTGSLSESLMHVSDFCEENLEHTTASLTTLIEPVLMIIMGLIVGFVALAIITPIYGITQNLTGS
jgi:type IV pilus assembly protein PilC